jgi:hypothetical protein
MADPLLSTPADVYGLLLVDDVCRRKADQPTAPELVRLELPRAEDLSDEEALARVLASEVSRHTLPERLAVAWAVRNMAQKTRKRIADLVCTPTCGQQGDRIGSGRNDRRRFSSARAPSQADRELARKVLAMPLTEDPTKGATHFFEPELLDRLHASGHPRIKHNSESLRRQWAGRGERKVATVGRIELWEG